MCMYMYYLQHCVMNIHVTPDTLMLVQVFRYAFNVCSCFSLDLLSKIRAIVCNDS